MTQGIQRNARPLGFSASYLARITPKARPIARKRRDGWFVEALGDVFRAIIGRREDEVPDRLIDDVGFGSHTHAAELRTELNRLDAQLHARFY
ncbi:MAG TPA: hypothetical protein VK903_11115 [Propionicimonas sp.]|nr:hypothetical protein [Propionicimonas sp.]